MKNIPLHANPSTWRPFSAKWTTLKVSNDGQCWVVYIKEFNPNLKLSVTNIGSKDGLYYVIPGAKFDTFYDAMVFAKRYTDWLMDAWRGATLLDSELKPCYSIKTAQYAIRPNTGRMLWDAFDLNRGLHCGRSESYDDALRLIRVVATEHGGYLVTPI